MKINALLVSAFAALCVLSGCSNVQEENLEDCQLDKPGTKIKNVCKGRFTFDPKDFSQDEIETLIIAQLEFNTFFGKELMKLSPASKQDSCHIERASLEGDTIGYYYPKTTNIALDMDKVKYQTNDSKEFIMLVQHEVAHSLSMIHASSGLMCSHGQGHYLSQVDLDQAKELGLIP